MAVLAASAVNNFPMRVMPLAQGRFEAGFRSIRAVFDREDGPDYNEIDVSISLNF